MSKSTILASGAINPSGDNIHVELVQPADLPATIRIIWPNHPTIVQPARYAEVAAAAMKVLATAVTRYNQLQAQR